MRIVLQYVCASMLCEEVEMKFCLIATLQCGGSGIQMPPTPLLPSHTALLFLAAPLQGWVLECEGSHQAVRREKEPAPCLSAASTYPAL